LSGERAQVELLVRRLKERGDAPALFWRGSEIACSRLLTEGDWKERLAELRVGQGSVCAFRGDYSPTTCALMLALMRVGAILVPFARSAPLDPALMRIGAVERLIEIDADDHVTATREYASGGDRLLDSFRSSKHSGLIVFSSGSTGAPKGIVHDMERVLKKFEEPRTAQRTLQFLLLDHFGGINTLFSVLSFGGVVVIPDERSPGHVAKLIESARVELLPVTPTFLKLFVASGAHRRHDMSSVKLITYGTEVMPEATLAQVRAAFPNARLQQTYGLSEVGVLRSRSRDSDSVWMRVGGTGFETRIVDGLLHVRSDYAMVGYLNAPDPFDEAGWLNTGDMVVQDGEWLRVLGRASDMINIAGQKVFPAEVEDVLMQAGNIVDATVRGEPHPLLGNIVVAELTLASPEDETALRQRLRKFCRSRMAAYKVPMRIEATLEVHHTERFKKVRPKSAG